MDVTICREALQFLKLLFKCQQAMLSKFFLEICALLHTDLVYINVNCVLNMHLSITNAHIPWPLPSFTLFGQGFSISFIFFCKMLKKHLLLLLILFYLSGRNEKGHQQDNEVKRSL